MILLSVLKRKSEEYNYTVVEEFILKILMPKKYNKNIIIKKALDDISTQMFGKEVFVKDKVKTKPMIRWT